MGLINAIGLAAISFLNAMGLVTFSPVNAVGLVAIGGVNAVGVVAVGGINAVGLVAIGGMNSTGIIAVGGRNVRSVLPRRRSGSGLEDFANARQIGARTWSGSLRRAAVQGRKTGGSRTGRRAVREPPLREDRWG